MKKVHVYAHLIVSDASLNSLSGVQGSAGTFLDQTKIDAALNEVDGIYQINIWDMNQIKQVLDGVADGGDGRTTQSGSVFEFTFLTGDALVCELVVNDGDQNASSDPLQTVNQSRISIALIQP